MFRTTSRIVAIFGLSLLCALGCSVAQDEDEPSEDAESVEDALTTTTVSKKPVRDSAKTSVIGVTDATYLFHNVDDGTSSTSADDATTYVRSATGVASASHTTGYTLGVPGNVTKIVAKYRADRGTA